MEIVAAHIRSRSRAGVGQFFFAPAAAVNKWSKTVEKPALPLQDRIERGLAPVV
jgi:hypothetical protein